MLKFRLIITYELILKLIGFIPNQLNGHRKMIFRNFAQIWSFLSRLDEVSSENGHLFENGRSSENVHLPKNGRYFSSRVRSSPFLAKYRNVIFPCRIFDQKLSNAPISNHTKFCMTYSGLSSGPYLIICLFGLWKFKKFSETITAKGEIIII